MTRYLLFAVAVPLAAQSVSVTYKLDSSWNTGLQAEMSITNRTAQAIPNWSFAFDYPLPITSIWDARVISHTGNRYVIGGAGWNNTLAANGSVAFGWIASLAQGTVSNPSNCAFANQAVSCGTGVTPDTVAPSVPTGLKSTGQTSTTVTLAWNASTDNSGGSGVASYDVLRSGVVVGTTAATSFTVVSLAPSAAYSFSVRARDNAGNVSAASAAISVSTSAQASCNVLPGVPTGLGVLTKTSTSITISWTAPTAQANCTTSYVVTADGVAVADSATTYTASGLQPSSTHTFSVVSKNQFGSSAAAGPLTVTPSASTPPPPNGWPTEVFAPYVDMLLWPTPTLSTIQTSSGVNYFTMAFIVSGATCQASWGGVIPLSQGFAVGDVASLRSQGGDVIVSFGGANGIELAQSCTSVAALTAQYQAVIDMYNLTRIDFDVEGAAQADPASIDLRNKAIAQLQATAASKGKQLIVQYTLPVLPTGLTADGVNVLSNALRNGVNIGLVNIMAMDYGGPQVANPNQMGANAVAAMNAVFAQMQTLYGSSKTAAQLRAMQGVTPMIGLNDVVPEVFTLTDAQTLLNAAQSSKIGLLATWSLGRDQSCPGSPQVSSTCSGVPESQYGFSNVFRAFTMF